MTVDQFSLWVVVSFATVRVWRLVAHDVVEFVDHVRALRAGDESWREFVDVGVSCPWCAGWWLSWVAVVVVFDVAVWRFVVLGLATSQVVGMLGERS